MEPAGEGEHLWLSVEKTGLTTTKVAELLGRAVGVRPRDVGYSGLKDRWAITQQWFSLPYAIRHGDDRPFADDRIHTVGDRGQFRVLRQQRHTRKLRHGTHAANHFAITLREVSGKPDELEADLARVAAQGVPNYFGVQRFGYEGRNLALARALFAGQRLRRNQRGFALSAARSYLFNCVLDARVRDDSWNQIVPGEAVMLDGTHSVFAATDAAALELASRLAAFDVHPSGPLPGKQGQSTIASGHALAVEQGVLAPHGDLVAGLVAAGVESARRALRAPVRDLCWHWRDDAQTLTVAMALAPGSYATSVLREIIVAEEAGGAGVTDRQQPD